MHLHKQPEAEAAAEAAAQGRDVEHAAKIGTASWWRDQLVEELPPTGLAAPQPAAPASPAAPGSAPSPSAGASAPGAGSEKLKCGEADICSGRG